MRDVLKQRYLVKGDPPSPVDPPPGCGLAQRCPSATLHCREISPRLDPIGIDHFVACHRVTELTAPDLNARS
jgi:peptide/nickel transport system ATP-binding protein